MDVAVIIPVHDRAGRLRAAVDSVLDQTAPVKELIVIDDGSADDPAAALSHISDKRLRIMHQPNLGVSAARNLGIKASGAEWVAFLDSDDKWLPEKIAAQAAFHAENEEFSISQTDEIWIRDGRRVNPREHHRKPSGDIFEASLERCLISPSAVVMRRSVLDDVGLFDPSLPACEDYDLWLRITCRYHVGLVPEKLVVKTGGHADQLSSAHWGMDRFRVRSLCNLIDDGRLTPKQRWAALESLAAKLTVLETGARKRGKIAEERMYSEMRERYTEPRPDNLTLFPDTE